MKELGASRGSHTLTSPTRGSRAPAVASIVIAILSFAIFKTAMAYPWQLAVLVGTAIGALVYSAQTTWVRMRKLYRRPNAGPLETDKWSETDGRSED